MFLAVFRSRVREVLANLALLSGLIALVAAVAICINLLKGLRKSLLATPNALHSRSGPDRPFPYAARFCGATRSRRRRGLGRPGRRRFGWALPCWHWWLCGCASPTGFAATSRAPGPCGRSLIPWPSARTARPWPRGVWTRRVRLWTWPAGRHATFEGHADAVLSVAISPDGKTLASGSLEGRPSSGRS